MDAYEATRVVFSRIQALDPENAATIMGRLLIQDHGDKEMIRLAFGPDSLLQSLVLKARKELVLLSPIASVSPFLLHRQNTPRPLAGLQPNSPSSWAPPPAFSRTNSSNGGGRKGDDLLNSADELISPSNPAPTSPFYGGDLADELQLSFLNDPAQIGNKGGDLFYPDAAGECRSPNTNGDGVPYPYWGANGLHRRSCSPADLCLGSDGFGWRPCLYFARGYCKNGSTCRFLHGVPDDSTVEAAMAAGSKMDAAVEQQCQELLLRSRSQRLGGASQLLASSFPYSPTGAMQHSPPSPSTKCMNFLLQHQQQNDTQRAATAAALMLGGDEARNFMGRPRMERGDLAGMVNPGSRQIYLTFPADSTFQEEDVSSYFSIYGPVQDVRIPYQQKRMFGFVTFVYPETVRLILAKGNPHFVCDARVLVKPYKEKGKVPDKYRKQQQGERIDFSGCTTPTGLDSRDPYDLQQLGARMVYNGGSQEMLMRRKLEEQQQQAIELQQAIDLQGRRFAGLQFLNLNARSLSSPTARINSNNIISTPEQSPSPEDKSPSPPAAATAVSLSQAADRLLSNNSNPHGLLHQAPVNGAADKEESDSETSPHEHSSDFLKSVEHNLPDSPFASPTRASFTTAEADFLAASPRTNSSSSNTHLIPSSTPTSTLDMASFKPCFFQMPRFPGHGAVRM